MPCTGSTALTALLVFGLQSDALADTNNRTGRHDLLVQRPTRASVPAVSAKDWGRCWTSPTHRSPANSVAHGRHIDSPSSPQIGCIPSGPDTSSLLAKSPALLSATAVR